MPTRIILIRHGETLWNAQKRYLGHKDIDLNNKGIKQAKLLAKRLNREKIHKVYSSDSSRALDFAKTIFKGFFIEKTPRLREMNFGVLEGKTYAEVIKRNPYIYDDWLKNPHKSVAPGCETMNDFRKRVRKIFKKVILLNKNKTTAVVTHAGPIKVIINDVLKSKNVWEAIPNPASISIIEIKRIKPNIILFNDTTHLKNG